LYYQLEGIQAVEVNFENQKFLLEGCSFLRYWSKTAKNESQLSLPLAAKRGNLDMPAQNHVIAAFISFLLLYGGFIQDVLNKRDMEFSGKLHQNFAQIGNFCFRGEWSK